MSKLSDPPVPELVIAPQTIPPGRIVAAQSYLIDRFVPDIEVIERPATERAGGALVWRAGPVVASSPMPKGRLKSFLASKPGKIEASEDRWILDLRIKDPDNWAHFLNNHIPLTFGLADAAGRDPARALLLLPADIPSYILQAAELFGLTVLATDDSVSGEGLEMSVTPWTALRAIRHHWAALAGPRAAISAVLDTNSEQKPLPRKVFLSRQGTRSLMNATEIETLLRARGFETVYPEALSPADQLRLFLGAEEMVAIHGAGLAPLLYCTPDAGPARLIELMPCGHMTDVYREMAAHVGTRWMGVRGRIKPEYVSPAYADTGPFKAYSLDPFEVDPVSLEAAFEQLA